MLTNPFARGSEPHLLVVGMTGAKLGERIAQIGCPHGGRLAAVAKKVGLSGHAVAIVRDEPSAERARKGAAAAGVLVEVEIAPPTRVPLEDAGFDLVLVDDTDGFFCALRGDDRVLAVREALRVLRPGGRVLMIGSTPRGGLGGLLTRRTGAPAFNLGPALEAGGFWAVRTLAEREGLVFVEGIKPRERPGGQDRQEEGQHR